MKTRQVIRIARRIARSGIGYDTDGTIRAGTNGDANPYAVLNWAFQQARPNGKPAGDIAKYNQEAEKILGAVKISWRTARRWQKQAEALSTNLRSLYDVGLLTPREYHKILARIYPDWRHPSLEEYKRSFCSSDLVR